MYKRCSFENRDAFLDFVNAIKGDDQKVVQLVQEFATAFDADLSVVEQHTHTIEFDDTNCGIVISSIAQNQTTQEEEVTEDE